MANLENSLTLMHKPQEFLNTCIVSNDTWSCEEVRFQEEVVRTYNRMLNIAKVHGSQALSETQITLLEALDEALYER